MFSFVEESKNTNEILRELREKAGYSLRNFSKVIELSPANISKLENGLVNPTIDVLLRYHKLFNVSLEYLCGLTIEQNTLNLGMPTYADKLQYALSTVCEDEQTKDFMEYVLTDKYGHVFLSCLVDAYGNNDYSTLNDFCKKIDKIRQKNMNYTEGEILSMLSR